MNQHHIQHPTSNIQHPTPNTQHPTSNIQHPTSNIQHPTPNIQHPTSNIQHPTSNHRPADRGRATSGEPEWTSPNPWGRTPSAAGFPGGWPQSALRIGPNIRTQTHRASPSSSLALIFRSHRSPEIVIELTFDATMEEPSPILPGGVRLLATRGNIPWLRGGVAL